MDTQTTQTGLETAPVVGYCACCTPRQLLIPRDDLAGPGRWAICSARGAWYANRGDGVLLPAPPPAILSPRGATQAGAWQPGQWAGDWGLPAIVPEVRIDLSKESYA